MASKALFAAVEFDLFTPSREAPIACCALEGDRNCGEPPLALLTALKSLGLVTEREDVSSMRQRRHDTWLRGHRAISATTSNCQRRFGYECFRHLGAALRGERIFPDKGFYEGLIYDAELAGQFSSAQHSAPSARHG